MKYHVKPTNKEYVMSENDFIVSKTNLKGIITYANRIFMDFAKYSETELLGTQHNIIRHPDMPRAVFKLLWDTIEAGNEIFAYVKNLAKDGAFYWVYANITPVYDSKKKMIGYYSVRRKPKKKAVALCTDLYKKMLEIEKRVGTKDGMQESTKYLLDVLKQQNKTYEEFVFEIQVN